MTKQGTDVDRTQAVQARARAEEIANELAILVAHEHRRAKDEQARREAAEATASQLAVLLAHDHAELDRERAARERAEEEVRELSALGLAERPAPRFVPAPRGTPRPRGVLQRVQ
jgi:hypothetical protein